MATLDNRNKNVANDPEINKVLDQEPPVIEPEKEIDPDIKEDLIDSQDKTVSDKDDDISDELQKKEVEEPEEPIEESEESTKKTKKEVKQNIEERYKKSSQEAMILYSKNKKLNDTIDEAANLPEPTEDELRNYAKLNDAVYDDLDIFTQNILKKTLMNERRFQKIDESRHESKRLDEWVTKVDDYINSPEVVKDFPVITDNAEEFRSYALKQGRRGVDFDILSASFLYELSQTPKVKKKGSLLLSGGNSKAAEPAPKGFSATDIAYMRKKDPRQLRKAIKEGKVNLEI
jgi:hypothetical protein